MIRRWMGMVLGLSLLASTAIAGAPPKPPPVGKPAPPFSLTLFSGQPVSLKEFQGKPVVIDFWHSG